MTSISSTNLSAYESGNKAGESTPPTTLPTHNIQTPTASEAMEIFEKLAGKKPSDFLPEISNKKEFSDLLKQNKCEIVLFKEVDESSKTVIASMKLKRDDSVYIISSSSKQGSKDFKINQLMSKSILTMMNQKWDPLSSF